MTKNRYLEQIDGEMVVIFGQHQGLFLSDVASEAPSYLRWMLKELNMPEDVRLIIEQALDDAG